MVLSCPRHGEHLAILSSPSKCALNIDCMQANAMNIIINVSISGRVSNAETWNRKCNSAGKFLLEIWRPVRWISRRTSEHGGLSQVLRIWHNDEWHPPQFEIPVVSQIYRIWQHFGGCRCTQVHVYRCVVCWLVQNILNTGAFEIFYDGKVVFSKMETGRLPRIQEVMEGMDKAMNEEVYLSPASTTAQVA